MQAYISTYGRDRLVKGRAIFLIHGAGMDQSVWTFQGRWLAFHGWSPLAVDLPGHGRSRGQRELMSIEEMAMWLGRLMEERRTGPSWIIGHSMGALVALEAAARFPEDVAGLVLLGAAAKMPVHPQLLELAGRHDPKTVELMIDWAFGPRGHLGGNALPGGWMMGNARSLLLRGDPEVLHIDLAACNAYGAGERAAGQVGCPTMVGIGASDRMTPPRAGRELADAIEGAQTLEIADSGHMMMLEQPDATLSAIRDFLTSAAPPAR